MSIWLGNQRLDSGIAHNIENIFYTTRNDTSLNGAVECNGGTYSTADYEGQGSIGELLRAGKLSYISLSAYSSAISSKGWCDKIGWDGGTTVRVPTLTPHIIQKNNIPVVGNGMTLGLTNGTGNYGLDRTGESGSWLGGHTSSYGQPVTSSGSGISGTGAGKFGITTDPTKSGIIADTTNTAQLRAMFQLFNSTTDEAVATVGTVVADVSGLKDMSNVTAAGKETVVGWGMPDYSAGVDLSLNTITTAPTDGYIAIVSDNTTSSYSNRVLLYLDGVLICQTVGTYAAAGSGATVPVNKGQQIEIRTSASSVLVKKFYPCKGV